MEKNIIQQFNKKTFHNPEILSGIEDYVLESVGIKEKGLSNNLKHTIEVVTAENPEINKDNFFTYTKAEFYNPDIPECLDILKKMPDYISRANVIFNGYDRDCPDFYIDPQNDKKLIEVDGDKKTTYTILKKIGEDAYLCLPEEGDTGVSSLYWYTDEGVYRFADHWGKVGTCRWNKRIYEDSNHRLLQESLEIDEYKANDPIFKIKNGVDAITLLFNHNLYPDLKFAEWEDFKVSKPEPLGIKTKDGVEVFTLSDIKLSTKLKKILMKELPNIDVVNMESKTYHYDYYRGRFEVMELKFKRPIGNKYYFKIEEGDEVILVDNIEGADHVITKRLVKRNIPSNILKFALMYWRGGYYIMNAYVGMSEGEIDYIKEGKYAYNYDDFMKRNKETIVTGSERFEHPFAKKMRLINL